MKVGTPTERRRATMWRAQRKAGGMKSWKSRKNWRFLVHFLTFPGRNVTHLKIWLCGRWQPHCGGAPSTNFWKGGRPLFLRPPWIQRWLNIRNNRLYIGKYSNESPVRNWRKSTMGMVTKDRGKVFEIFEKNIRMQNTGVVSIQDDDWDVRKKVQHVGEPRNDSVVMAIVKSQEISRDKQIHLNDKHFFTYVLKFFAIHQPDVGRFSGWITKLWNLTRYLMLRNGQLY